MSNTCDPGTAPLSTTELRVTAAMIAPLRGMFNTLPV
jgi:hypothetical protein